MGGPADLKVVCSPADCSVRRADDCSPAAALDDWEADNSADDSANCHRSLAGWPTPPVAGGTRGAADDKDSAIQPKTRGCNKRGVIPSSIPIHPIPTAGY